MHLHGLFCYIAEDINMKIVTKKMSDIHPYENNPRINDLAVDSVAESIRQCGYIQKIVVDEKGVILAGHTRFKALQKLGYTECEVAVAENLSEKQKKKYRLLYNKTNELAAWDFEKLDEELSNLDFDDFDFGFPDGEEVSYIDNLMDENFAGAGKEHELFSVTLNFPVEVEEQVMSYIKENTKDPLVDAVLAVVKGKS